MVETHAQQAYIIHVYVYNEQPVSQDSNHAAHTLPRSTATTQGSSCWGSCTTTAVTTNITITLYYNYCYYNKCKKNFRFITTCKAHRYDT